MLSQKIALIVSFILSLYLCTGGIGDIIISNKKEEARLLPESPVQDEVGIWHKNAGVAEASDELRSLYGYYPMYSWEPTLSYIITLMGFGVLGSCIRLFLSFVKSGETFQPPANSWIWIILGCVIGLFVLVLDEALLPDFKTRSGNNKVYYSTALLGGLFTPEFFEKLSSIFNKEAARKL